MQWETNLDVFSTIIARVKNIDSKVLYNVTKGKGEGLTGEAMRDEFHDECDKTRTQN